MSSVLTRHVNAYMFIFSRENVYHAYKSSLAINTTLNYSWGLWEDHVNMKSQTMTKAITIHPEGNMNVSTKVQVQKLLKLPTSIWTNGVMMASCQDTVWAVFGEPEIRPRWMFVPNVAYQAHNICLLATIHIRRWRGWLTERPHHWIFKDIRRHLQLLLWRPKLVFWAKPWCFPDPHRVCVCV